MRLSPLIISGIVMSGAIVELPVTPYAVAAECADVKVVFARGTSEDAGVGDAGRAFIDALRVRLDGKSVAEYGVKYPASNDWPTGVEGIADAKNTIMTTIAECPDTKMVLGGFSQGAAVAAFVTSENVPEGVDPRDVPTPMPPEAAEHVAAVVLFGTPNSRAMDLLGQPHVQVGPIYADKTVKLCAEEDPVCSEGMNFWAHTAYGSNGIPARGADFAANRILGRTGTWN